MTDNQTLPPPQGPEYARCFGCGHIEPEHRPGTGPCLMCSCAAYRAVPAVPVSPPPPDQTAARAAVLREAGWAECSPEWLAAHPGECCTAPRVPGGPDVSHWHPDTALLRRLAAEAQQPDTETRP